MLKSWPFPILSIFCLLLAACSPSPKAPSGDAPISETPTLETVVLTIDGMT